MYPLTSFSSSAEWAVCVNTCYVSKRDAKEEWYFYSKKMTWNIWKCCFTHLSKNFSDRVPWTRGLELNLMCLKTCKSLAQELTPWTSECAVAENDCSMTWLTVQSIIVRIELCQYARSGGNLQILDQLPTATANAHLPRDRSAWNCIIFQVFTCIRRFELRFKYFCSNSEGTGYPFPSGWLLSYKVTSLSPTSELKQSYAYVMYDKLYMLRCVFWYEAAVNRTDWRPAWQIKHTVL